MPGRSTSHLAFHERRRWFNTPQVLVLRLPEVSHQGAMHQRRVSANRPLGERARTRGYAKAPGPHTAGLATASADRRTPLRNAQSMDGSDTLPDQNAPSRKYTDEPACVVLQLQTIDPDSRNTTSDPRDPNITSFASLIASAGETRIGLNQ